MKTKYEVLSVRIRDEVLDLDHVVQRALHSWNESSRSPGEQAFIDSVALNLHSFYSGLEKLFELIARHVDGSLPDGETWHQDLLVQMSKDLKPVRPAVIGQDNVRELGVFRRFRHLVRNVYAMDLVPERMSGLMDALPDVWADTRAELLAFADFLDELAEALGTDVE